jgi:hypothetical protein
MAINFSIPEQYTQFNYDEIINGAEVFKDKFYEKPVILLHLPKTKADCSTVKIPVFTACNISGIQGKAKSRKTFFLALATKLIYAQKQIELVIFDTEQAFYHSSLTLKRIFSMSPNINLRFFNLRKYSQDVRLEFIETYILKNKPDLVFIDNIRDCLSNINSIEQANEVLNTFKQLLDITGVHVCMTLHENPGKDNDKARGHLGTELQNCAETIFKVEKDSGNSEYSNAKGLFTRNGDFDDLMFMIEDGIPRLCNDINFVKVKDVF